MFRALAHRDYRYLTAGMFSTHLGAWVQSLGQGWLVYQITHSPLQLGLVGFCGGSGMLIFAPIGGSLADRLDRRKLMLTGLFFAMLVSLLLAILVATDLIRVWHIYFTSFVSSALFSIVNPTKSALVYDLVPKDDLPNAIALNAILSNANRILGPTVGGGLLTLIGNEGTFFFQAGSIVLAMVMALQIRGVYKSQGSNPSLVASIAGGIRYARRVRDIGLLLCLAVANGVLAWPYMQLLPAYTSEVLGMDRTGFGAAMACMGIGAVIGAVFIATRDIGRKGKYLLIAQTGAGAFLVVMGLSNVIAISFAALAFMGLCGAFQMAMTQILLQTKVADEFRGRVLSLNFLTFGLQPFSVLPAGAIGERWGVDTALLILGVLLFGIVGAVAMVSKRARAW